MPPLPWLYLEPSGLLHFFFNDILLKPWDNYCSTNTWYQARLNSRFLVKPLPFPYPSSPFLTFPLFHTTLCSTACQLTHTAFLLLLYSPASISKCNWPSKDFNFSNSITQRLFMYFYCPNSYLSSVTSSQPLSLSCSLPSLYTANNTTCKQQHCSLFSFSIHQRVRCSLVRCMTCHVLLVTNASWLLTLQTGHLSNCYSHQINIFFCSPKNQTRFFRWQTLYNYISSQGILGLLVSVIWWLCLLGSLLLLISHCSFGIETKL